MKNYIMALFLSLLFNAVHAQVSIKKDYFRNGSRVLELNYKGLDYSLIMKHFNADREAELFFENLIRRKALKIRINENSTRAFDMNYAGQDLLNAVVENKSLKVTQSHHELDENDIADLEAFNHLYDEFRDSWPEALDTEVDPGNETLKPVWRFVALTAGGSLSIANSRCNHVHNNIEIEENCFPVTDCGCLHSAFLCYCLCGLICDE